MKQTRTKRRLAFLELKILKETDMKKLLAFIILSVATVSCYEDYIHDYIYTSIYFPYQIDVRTFVVGEGMNIEVGAALGGVRKNNIDREITFRIDPTLITPAVLAQMKGSSMTFIKDAATPVAALQLLPSNYYTLSNTNTMIIKAGQHMGSIVVKADSVNFLNDSINTLYATYASTHSILKMQMPIQYSKVDGII